MAEFAFKIRAQQWRTDPYYVGSSAPVYPVEVVAETKQEAINEAARMLGDPARDRYWRFWVDSVKDARLKQESQGSGVTP